MRILVTPRSLTAEPHPAVEALRTDGFDLVHSRAGRLPGEDELLALVPDVDGWLAGIEPVSARVIGAATRLRVVSRNGTGVDNLPLDLLKARGIAVLTADGANAPGVAELAIGLILSALRHVPAADAGIKAGGWPRRVGREIRSLTVGVVGCGAIGADVARLAAGLGARIVAHDPRDPPLAVPADRLVRADLDTLLARSDVVTLHCPAPRDGRAVLDAAALRRMRPGAVLVNTARAALVDEAALVAALDEGRLSGYATDVFDEEPPRSLALAGRADVIATSHVGGLTRESVDRATEIAVANLRAELRG